MRLGLGTPTRVDVNDMATRPRGVGAYRHGWKGEGGRLANEWSMDEDLQVIVMGVEHGGLAEEVQVLSIWVPSDWDEG